MNVPLVIKPPLPQHYHHATTSPSMQQQQQPAYHHPHHQHQQQQQPQHYPQPQPHDTAVVLGTDGTMTTTNGAAQGLVTSVASFRDLSRLGLPKS